MDTIKTFINKLLCSIFGHKKLHVVMAYSITVYSMSSKVEIYEVSICQRCGRISTNRIDWYEKYNWYTTRIAKAEEEKLRKQGAVTMVEAYNELRGYKYGSHSFVWNITSD